MIFHCFYVSNVCEIFYHLPQGTPRILHLTVSLFLNWYIALYLSLTLTVLNLQWGCDWCTRLPSFNWFLKTRRGFADSSVSMWISMQFFTPLLKIVVSSFPFPPTYIPSLFLFFLMIPLCWVEMKREEDRKATPKGVVVEGRGNGKTMILIYKGQQARIWKS